MKTAFCLSIGPFWEKRFFGKKFGLFIIFGLLANFFNLLSNNFLRGFQSCLLCFHQIVSKKNHLFLKKNSKFFHHFRILSKNFWPSAIKNSLDLSKLASTCPKVQSEAKKFFLKIVQFSKQARTLDNKTSFFVKKFSAGLSKLHFMFLLEHSEKNKNFFWKKPSLPFLNLG